MKKANLYFGMVLFVSFLFSGYYMMEYFSPENMDNIIGRMQIRSNHIYMLLIALLNVVSYKCNLNTGSQLSRYAINLSRFILICSGILAVLAFMYEHNGDLDGRIFTFFSIVLSVSSIGIAALNEIIFFYKSRKVQEQ